MAGVHDVLPDRPDLILSGVNRGNNSGENAVYSGTLGGAMEGALQGIPAIALSQFMGPATAVLDDPFEAAAVHGVAVLRRLLDQGIWGGDGYQLFYNVNFPALPADRVKGLRVARQGLRPAFGFGVEAQTSPSGRRFLWVRGSEQAVDTGPGTDVTANLAGYVSITPMRADLTAHDVIDDLGARFQ
jgi:5'-nucleotidase